MYVFLFLFDARAVSYGLSSSSFHRHCHQTVSLSQKNLAATACVCTRILTDCSSLAYLLHILSSLYEAGTVGGGRGEGFFPMGWLPYGLPSIFKDTRVFPEYWGEFGRKGFLAAPSRYGLVVLSHSVTLY